MLLDIAAMFEEGLQREWTKRVDLEDTMGNSCPALKHLLATDACARLMVHGATALVDPILPEGFISVGTRSEIVHEAAAALGMTVTCRVTLRKIHDNRLIFDFLCFDKLGQVAHGYHHRIVVGREALVSRVEARTERLLHLVPNPRS
jgi:predicted thioesterase